MTISAARKSLLTMGVGSRACEQKLITLFRVNLLKDTVFIYIGPSQARGKLNNFHLSNSFHLKIAIHLCYLKHTKHYLSGVRLDAQGQQKKASLPPGGYHSSGAFTCTPVFGDQQY